MQTLEYVNAAIEYIESHLNETMDLAVVSQAVHCSKYHLHRIFSETTGITLHDYIQRRQLTEAAKRLVFSRKSILSIALESGYKSQQSFSTVFKKMYKYSPHQFRKNELFYPLQLKYEFGYSTAQKLKQHGTEQRQIRFASEDDIPAWMELVQLVIDGYPNLVEEHYIRVLRESIRKQQALIMTEGSLVLGIMMICYATDSIDFLGVHPLFRKQGITKQFLDKAITELLDHRQVTTITFQEGDHADTGYRRELLELGFAEAELLTELGYPAQKMIYTDEQEEKNHE